MIYIPTLRNSPSEIRMLERFLSNIIGKEFSNMLGPCYNPKPIKYYNDLKRYTGFDDSDVNKFFKSMPSNYIRNFKIISNKITILILLSILFYSQTKKFKMAELFYYLLAIRFYSNSFSKHWRFCKDDVWKKAEELLSIKHLFKVKSGIPNAIMYLGRTEYEKRKDLLTNKNINEDDILKTLYAIRHRVAQSVRSFANRYYEEEAMESRDDIKTAKELELKSKGDIVEFVSSGIATYRQIDNNAMSMAESESRVRKDIVKLFIKDLTHVKNRNDLEFILNIINKFQNLKEVCLDYRRKNLIRRVIQDTRKIDKFSIKETIINLIEEQDNYKKYRTINKNQMVLVFLSYITHFIKNRVCA